MAGAALRPALLATLVVVVASPCQQKRPVQATGPPATKLRAILARESDPDRLADSLLELARRMASTGNSAPAHLERQHYVVGAIQALQNGALARVPAAARRQWSELHCAMAAESGPALQAWAEYYCAAWLARAGEVRAAADRLSAFAAAHPGEPVQRAERVTLAAQCLALVGDWDASLQLLDRMEAQCPADNHGAQTLLHGTRAEVLRMLGVIDRAVVEAARARQHARASGDSEDAWTALVRWANLQLLLGRHAAVEAELAPLLERPPPGFDDHRRALLLLLLGATRAAEERSGIHTDPTARQLLDRAVALGIAETELKMQAQVKLMDLALRAGDLDRAERSAESARRTAVRTGLANSPEGQWPVLVAQETTLLLAQWHRAGSPDAWRGRLEKQAARHRRALDLMLARWDRLPTLGTGVGFLYLGRRRMVLCQLIELLMALDRRADAVQCLLDAEQRTSLSRALAAPATTLADVRAELMPRGYGVLIYLRSWSHSLLVAFDATRVRCFELPRDQECLAAARALTEALAIRPPESGGARHRAVRRIERAAAAATRTLLPAEAAAWIAAWRGATLVGAGLLEGAPLECLQLPSGRLLGEQLAVETTSSLPLLRALRRRCPPPAKRPRATFAMTLMQAGALAEAKHLGPAAALPREGLDGFLATYPRGDRTVLTDRHATVSALGAAPLHGEQVLQLLGHGVPDPSGESGTLLALAPDDSHPRGLLRSRDVIGWQVSGVVILSACRIDQSTPRPGDDLGVATLVGAFLRAGAPCAISSRGDVVLSDHLRLLDTLHRRLAAGDAPAEALRAAREALHRELDPLAFLLQAQTHLHGLGLVPVAARPR